MARARRKYSVTFYHEDQYGFQYTGEEPVLPVEAFVDPGANPRHRQKSLIRTNESVALTEKQLRMILWDADWEHPSQYVWTDNEILALREGMLLDRIRTLLDFRNGLETRLEIWEWIHSDEIAPFSFRPCVEACCNFVDHVELREQLVDLIKSKGKVPVAK
tara:strand:- start:1701 stop:2183 length:483 start_codon:yes stop_codon:yes gene_type:complete